MDIINKEQYDKAEETQLPPEVTEIIPQSIDLAMTAEEITKSMKELEHPIIHQKELAIKIRKYLDHRIQYEMNEFGSLSDELRKWVKDYNEILNNIQKSLFGDKTINIHQHIISHSAIAAKIRKHKDDYVETKGTVMEEELKENDDRTHESTNAGSNQ